MPKHHTPSPSDPFLDDDYEVPKKPGKYLKFQKGENRIRILGKPLLGWVAWKTGEDGKKSPIRRATNEFKPGEFDKKNEPKHFWAMPVFDYATGMVKVLEITQSTIQTVIKDLSGNKKWGAPYAYDIVITAVGDGMEREYSIIPDPKEPLSVEATDAWGAIQDTFDITRLMVNGDPFGDEGAGNGGADSDDDIPF